MALRITDLRTTNLKITDRETVDLKTTALRITDLRITDLKTTALKTWPNLLDHYRSKDNGSKDNGSKDSGSKDHGSKDNGSKGTSSDGSSDFLYGSSSDEDIFEIAADAGTTYIDNFDMSADTLDLSEVITDEAVTEESLGDYLEFSNVDSDGQKDDTELTVDADGDSKTTDDQTTIYIQDSTLNENDLDDMNIDFQND